jgi:acyl carrier protein
MKRADLEQEIRELILASVDVEGLSAEDLAPGAGLFADGIGLDSIDALEIGAALRKKYHVKFRANADENRGFFKSIATLADFVAQNAGIELE